MKKFAQCRGKAGSCYVMETENILPHRIYSLGIEPERVTIYETERFPVFMKQVDTLPMEAELYLLLLQEEHEQVKEFLATIKPYAADMAKEMESDYRRVRNTGDPLRYGILEIRYWKSDYIWAHKSVQNAETANEKTLELDSDMINLNAFLQALTDWDFKDLKELLVKLGPNIFTKYVGEWEYRKLVYAINTIARLQNRFGSFNYLRLPEHINNTYLQ